MATPRRNPRPTPTPRRSDPPPRPTPGPPSEERRFHAIASEEFGRIRRELTSAQRRSIKDVPFRTSPSIAQVGGREVAGRTFFRQGPIVTRAVQRGLQAVGKAPKTGIRISQRASNLPAAIRHETAHAVLFKAKVPVKQQHAVIRLARVGTKGKIDFPLLPQATRLATGPSTPGRERAKKQLRQRLTIRARRLAQR